MDLTIKILYFIKSIQEIFTEEKGKFEIDAEALVQTSYRIIKATTGESRLYGFYSNHIEET